MAWTVSGAFTNGFKDVFTGTALDLDTDTFVVALYNNSITPAYDAASASTYYNTGAWATAQEVYGTGWAQGGISPGTPQFTLTAGSPAATQLKFDFPDISQPTTTLTNAYGCLIYDGTDVNDQGICGVYFGGTAYSTVAGTFAITWDTNGVFYLDLA